MKSNHSIILIVVSSMAVLAFVTVGGIIYRFSTEATSSEALVNGVFALAGSLLGYLGSILTKTVPTPIEQKSIKGTITSDSPTNQE